MKRRRRVSLLRILYNFYVTASALATSMAAWRRRHEDDSVSRERQGVYTPKFRQAITNRNTLWLTADTTSAANLCTQLLRILERRLPQMKFVVSATTDPVMAELRNRLPRHISPVYHPTDASRCVVRALRAVWPQAVVAIGGEIWPNFLGHCWEVGIPIVVVSSRLSEGCFRRYKRYGSLFRPLFESLDCLAAQTEQEAARFAQLGCRPAVIKIVGNLSFGPANLREQHVTDVRATLRQLGIREDAPVLVADTAHPAEDAILVDTFLRLRASFPHVFLVLAPRRGKHARFIRDKLEAVGIRFAYRNAITSAARFVPGEVDCLLLNTASDLSLFQGHATVIFIGNTFGAHGGQDPLDAAGFGRPLVFGPHMQNFAKVAARLVAKNAALQVQDAPELEKMLSELLRNDLLRERLGINARALAQEYLRPIQRISDLVLTSLKTKARQTGEKL